MECCECGREITEDEISTTCMTCGRPICEDCDMCQDSCERCELMSDDE